MKKLYLVAAFLFAFLLFKADILLAFERNDWHLCNDSLLMTTNSNDFEDGGDYEAAVISAMQEWNDVAKSGFTFTDTRGSCSVDNHADGKSCIGFKALGPGSWGQAHPGVIIGGCVREVDVIFNTSNIDWVAQTERFEAEHYSCEVPVEQASLHTVAIHELGHALGLEHSEIFSTMTDGYTLGQHSLTSDDMKGVRTIHPGNPTETSYNLSVSNWYVPFGRWSVPYSEIKPRVYYMEDNPTIDLEFTLDNSSTEDLQNVRIGFYLSSDISIDTNDILLGSETRTQISKEYQETVQRTFSIPQGTASGTYYVGIYVDDTNVIAEDDETDNTVAHYASIEIIDRNVIYVPGDYSTIYDAVNSVASGESALILVSPGTYYETIQIWNKNIEIKSTHGPEATVIDAQGQGSVVAFNNIEGERAGISGFTLRNGHDQMGSAGSGIMAINSSVTIKNNIIQDNQGREAGGIYVKNFESGQERYVDIFNNLIVNNTGAGSGGGIYLDHDRFNAVRVSKIINNTIIGNYSYLNGGGIASKYQDFEIKNSIIRDNQASAGSSVYVQSNDSSAAVTYSNIDGVDRSGNPWASREGNIDEDPLFSDPANGDYSLYDWSPCIDLGVDDENLPDKDILGNGRFDDVNMLNVNGEMIDIGAYERQNHSEYEYADVEISVYKYLGADWPMANAEVTLERNGVVFARNYTNGEGKVIFPQVHKATAKYTVKKHYYLTSGGFVPQFLEEQVEAEVFMSVNKDYEPIGPKHPTIYDGTGECAEGDMLCIKGLTGGVSF